MSRKAAAAETGPCAAVGSAVFTAVNPLGVPDGPAQLENVYVLLSEATAVPTNTPAEMTTVHSRTAKLAASLFMLPPFPESRRIDKPSSVSRATELWLSHLSISLILILPDRKGHRAFTSSCVALVTIQALR